MGWFWAEPTPAVPRVCTKRGPPPGCPMHKKTVEAVKQDETSGTAPPSPCPVPHNERPSLLSQINPLNRMFRDISQEPAENQAYKLPTSREVSSIPKGSGETKWEYPSPQQMYNALLRKGYDDTDVMAVEQMVAVHNFLNEGAWQEVVGWEQRFGDGLWKGFQVCKKGEENTQQQLQEMGPGPETEPTLVRFQGRPKDMTPKAAMWQLLGKVYPGWFGVDPPFDRHDWYVSRNVNGQVKEVRYVIDYYSGPPEPTGEPVFFLDVRPAMTPTGAAARLIRWGTDTWWRASGGDVREAEQRAQDSS